MIIQVRILGQRVVRQSYVKRYQDNEDTNSGFKMRMFIKNSLWLFFLTAAFTLPAYDDPYLASSSAFEYS